MVLFEFLAGLSQTERIEGDGGFVQTHAHQTFAPDAAPQFQTGAPSFVRSDFLPRRRDSR